MSRERLQPGAELSPPHSFSTIWQSCLFHNTASVRYSYRRLQRKVMKGLLTRKQEWRRTSCGRRARLEQGQVFEIMLWIGQRIKLVKKDDFKSRVAHRAQRYHRQTCSLPSEIDSWFRHWYDREGSTDSISSSSVSKKSVNFNMLHNITTIPNKDDIDKSQCWWRKEDIDAFKSDAMNEIRDFQHRHAYADSRKASFALYQSICA